MKKNNLHFAIAAICLAIVCAFCMFFLNNRVLLMSVAAFLIIALIMSIILIHNHTSVVSGHISKLNNKYQADLGGLKARLAKSEELRSRYREILTQLEQENKDTRADCSKEIQSKIQCYTDFKNNVVVPYLTDLKKADMPLDSLAKQKIIDSTIELAMQAIDVADASDWSINNRPEQKLNLEVVSQKKTKTDAYAEAIVITDNPAVTPKWIRALYTSVKDIVSDSSMIIFSGYKR